MPTALQLKTFPEILFAMFATARSQLDPDIDLNIGSLLRAIYEACALQDAEQYVQIGKLLDLFARSSAKGEDLDRRALDYGAAVFTEMRRRQANTSIAALSVGDGTTQRRALLSGDVLATATSFVISDATSWPSAGAATIERGTLREEVVVFTRSGTTITVVSPITGMANPHIQGGSVETVSTKSTLAAGISIGAAAFQLTAGTETAWPASGTVIFERDSIRRESRTFTRVSTTMTLGAVTTFAHGISTDVTLSTFGSDRPISAGTAAFVPESVTSVRILFRTTASGLLLDGDYVSSLIPCESDGVGSQTRVGSNTITQWQTEPFANASVTNPNAATRGRDREDDDTYNARIAAFIQSLSRATALAIETLVAGQQDPFSSLTIAFAQTVEPVAPGQSLLYITDGTTTFNADSQVKTGRVVLINDARTNDRRAHLPDYGPFAMVASPDDQRTPRVFKNETNGYGVASSQGSGFLEDNTQTWVVDQWAGMEVKADDGVFYTITSNTAIRLNLASGTPSLGQYAIFDLSLAPLQAGVDFIFNQSTGDLELVLSLAEHESLIAADDNALASVGAYTYTRGLVAHAQRLVNGDRTDVDAFPGIKALGTSVLATVPTIISPTFTIQVITASGFTDADLQTVVQSVVQAYVNGLGMGTAVQIAEISKRVKSLVGVSDCKVLFPTANVPVPDGQMARINASDVQVV
jgi:uncharacterized phage protein gp47/JayE